MRQHERENNGRRGRRKIRRERGRRDGRKKRETGEREGNAYYENLLLFVSAAAKCRLANPAVSNTLLRTVIIVTEEKDVLSKAVYVTGITFRIPVWLAKTL